MIPKRIALIGFMASGKTCVGEKLAARLGYSAGDTDCMVETSAGMTISEIFEIEGEDGFRTREAAALALSASVSARGIETPIVLSCGGGIVLSERNREILASDFFSVWLDVPLEEILKRLKGQRSFRPLLAGEKFEERARSLYLARRELYGSCAKFRYVWKAGENSDSTVESVLAALEIPSGRDFA